MNTEELGPWPKAKGNWGNTSLGQGPLRILSSTIDESNFSLWLQTQAAMIYTLEYKSVIGGGAWEPLATVEGDGSRRALTDPEPTPDHRFYRVRSDLLAPPRP